ncbi:MAG: 1-deoxy-D-xylulose-5-phosphate reductoisomerase, partial [Planctomycetota bacterium]
FQCLLAGRKNEVRSLILTASGGPFRESSHEDLQRVTVEQALNHPTWDMGAKVTIDSATLMNKSLEVIEARWLFDLPPDQIDVVVHPQSIVHSMVEYVDGSTIAHLGPPDMRVPIQYALTYPERKPLDVPRLRWGEVGKLIFQDPDKTKFPALRIAYEVLHAGGTAPTVFNAANEVAVAAFLDERVSFLGIIETVEQALSAHSVITNPSLDEIFAADVWAREEATRLLGAAASQNA